MYISFLYNIFFSSIVCLAGAVISFFINKKADNIYWGIILGACTVMTMNQGVIVSEGMFYDFRHVILLLSGYIGNIPGLIITAAIASLYRVSLGGIGTVGGIMAIFSYGLIGIFLRRVYWKYKLTRFNPIIFWFIVGNILSVIALLIVFIYPPYGVDKTKVFNALLMPYITFTPIAAALLFNLYFQLEKAVKGLHTLIAIQKYSPVDLLIFQDNSQILFYSNSFKNNKDLKEYLQNPLQLLDTDKQKQLIRIDENNNEYTICLNNNRHYSVRLSSFLSNNGEQIHMALFTEITKLIYQQKTINVLSRYELLGQMSAGLSHEIRNPITTVRGFLQLFKMNPKRPNFLQECDLMISELDRATNVITELLSLGKTKDSKKQMVSLNEVLNDLYPILMANAFKENKNIMLDLRQIPAIRLNINEIKQVIVNLVKNGLEAMTKGTLSISTSLAGSNIRLSIKDEGPGINSEHINNIGTPFFTTKKNGTGLGLVTCYNLVSKNNATMDFETNEQGTTFIIEFKTAEELSADEAEKYTKAK